MHRTRRKFERDQDSAVLDVILGNLANLGSFGILSTGLYILVYLWNTSKGLLGYMIKRYTGTSRFPEEVRIQVGTK